MIRIKFLFPACLIFIFFTGVLAAEEKPVSEEICQVLAGEKNSKNKEKINDIISSIDNIYADLYDKLKAGKKLVVFFDPAHGKLPDGRWQGGAATRRQSCTNKPEEYYSIIISREMYKRLKGNPYIEVKSSPDFLEVLEGHSDTYLNLTFPETVALAKNANAFIIISEHLNNVSVIEKASGIMNIPGIHVTRNLKGQKILKYVSNSYEGFLTLYNKLDTSGFSKAYAVNLKASLMNKGLKPNNWEHGAVGDDRFTYFVDFPVSVIYESGFISNPYEEKLLATEEYGALLADSQYNSFLKSINEIFKVDISGSTVKKAKEYKGREDFIELMKLSRIAVYYLGNTDTTRALRTINIMEKRFSSSALKDQVAYFKGIRSRIQTSEGFYNSGVSNIKKKNKNTAVRYFKKAYSNISSAPIYSAYRKKYANAFKGNRNIAEVAVSYRSRPYYRKEPSLFVPKAPKLRTILFPIEEGQSVSDAIEAALAPNEATLKKLTASFANASNAVLKKHKVWLQKKKKYVTSWKRINTKVQFTKGIYLVSIDGSLKVTKVRKVSNVLLDHKKYQNQQYLKNSYFAETVKERAL